MGAKCSRETHVLAAAAAAPRPSPAMQERVRVTPLARGRSSVALLQALHDLTGRNVDANAILDIVLSEGHSMVSLHAPDARATYMYVSTGFESVLGWTAAELIDQPSSVLFHPSERAHLEAELARSSLVAMHMLHSDASVADRGACKYRMLVKPKSDQHTSDIDQDAKRRPRSHYKWVETRTMILVASRNMRRTSDSSTHGGDGSMAGTPAAGDAGVKQDALGLTRSGHAKDAFLLCLTRDVTEQHHAEKQQRMELVSKQSAETRRAIIRFVCHELRVPMNDLSLGLQELADEVETVRTGQEHGIAAASPDSHSGETLRTPAGGTCPHATRLAETLSMLQTANVAMQNIFNNILYLSQLEGSPFSLTFERFNPAEMVEECVAIHASAAGAKRISMEAMSHIPDALTGVMLEGNRFHLQQAVNHYIANSLRYTPQSGHVVVHLYLASLEQLWSSCATTAASEAEAQTSDTVPTVASVHSAAPFHHDGDGGAVAGDSSDRPGESPSVPMSHDQLAPPLGISLIRGDTAAAAAGASDVLPSLQHFPPTDLAQLPRGRSTDPSAGLDATAAASIRARALSQGGAGRVHNHLMRNETLHSLSPSIDADAAAAGPFGARSPGTSETSSRAARGDSGTVSVPTIMRTITVDATHALEQLLGTQADEAAASPHNVPAMARRNTAGDGEQSGPVALVVSTTLPVPRGTQPLVGVTSSDPSVATSPSETARSPGGNAQPAPSPATMRLPARAGSASPPASGLRSPPLVPWDAESTWTPPMTSVPVKSGVVSAADGISRTGRTAEGTDGVPQTAVTLPGAIGYVPLPPLPAPGCGSILVDAQSPACPAPTMAALVGALDTSRIIPGSVNTRRSLRLPTNSGRGLETVPESAGFESTPHGSLLSPDTQGRGSAGDSTTSRLRDESSARAADAPGRSPVSTDGIRPRIISPSALAAQSGEGTPVGRLEAQKDRLPRDAHRFRAFAESGPYTPPSHVWERTVGEAASSSIGGDQAIAPARASSQHTPKTVASVHPPTSSPLVRFETSQFGVKHILGIPFLTQADVSTFADAIVASGQVANAGSSAPWSGAYQQRDGSGAMMHADSTVAAESPTLLRESSDGPASPPPSGKLPTSGQHRGASASSNTMSGPAGQVRNFEFSVPCTSGMATSLYDAREATDATAAVAVAPSDMSDWVVCCIAVEDDGEGIDTRKATSLFVPYVQLNARNIESGAGGGLGLSIVREVVRLHGGRAGAASLPGRGSVFYMLFPLRKRIQSDATPEVAGAGAAAAAAHAGQQSVARGPLNAEASRAEPASAPPRARRASRPGLPPRAEAAPSSTTSSLGLSSSPLTSPGGLVGRPAALNWRGVAQSRTVDSSEAASPLPMSHRAVQRPFMLGSPPQIAYGPSPSTELRPHSMELGVRAAGVSAEPGTYAGAVPTAQQLPPPALHQRGENGGFARIHVDTQDGTAREVVRRLSSGASIVNSTRSALAGAVTTPTPRTLSGDVASRMLATPAGLPATELHGVSRALIVEDVPSSRLLLSRQLSRQGVAGELAEDGIQAVQKVMSLAGVPESIVESVPVLAELPQPNMLAEFSKHAFSLEMQTRLAQHLQCILLDAQMPRMDGYTTARAFRQLSIGVPVIGVSANALSDDIQRFVDAGVDAFVPKPVSLPQLLWTMVRVRRQGVSVSTPSVFEPRAM